MNLLSMLEIVKVRKYDAVQIVQNIVTITRNVTNELDRSGITCYERSGITCYDRYYMPPR